MKFRLVVNYELVNGIILLDLIKKNTNICTNRELAKLLNVEESRISALVRLGHGYTKHKDKLLSYANISEKSFDMICNDMREKLSTSFNVDIVSIHDLDNIEYIRLPISKLKYIMEID